MTQNYNHDEIQLQLLYDIQQASVIRTKTVFSLVFISLHYSVSNESTQTQRYDALYHFVAAHARNTDRVYRHPSERFVIAILPFSGNNEAHAYFERLIAYLPQQFDNTVSLVATINEIGNAQHSLQQVIEHNILFLRSLEGDEKNISYTIDKFSKTEVETIKVSILENNAVAMSILQNSVQNMNIRDFELQLETFTDGLQFLNTDWHRSGHTHIVIVNDTLPFKNGLEVISYLRALPNNEKYIIILISKRATEESIIYAYNNGVDAYFTRPFNIHLLEARLKNMLRRLR